MHMRRPKYALWPWYEVRVLVWFSQPQTVCVSIEQVVMMRYPGEWKYAGGGIEDDESPRDAGISKDMWVRCFAKSACSTLRIIYPKYPLSKVPRTCGWGALLKAHVAHWETAILNIPPQPCVMNSTQSWRMASHYYAFHTPFHRPKKYTRLLFLNNSLCGFWSMVSFSQILAKSNCDSNSCDICSTALWRSHFYFVPRTKWTVCDTNVVFTPFSGGCNVCFTPKFLRDYAYGWHTLLKVHLV